jgi:hypothetical protein
MRPSLIQRQCAVTPYGFTVAICALPSFRTALFLPTVHVANFLKHMTERLRSCSFNQCRNGAAKINGAGTDLMRFRVLG